MRRAPPPPQPASASALVTSTRGGPTVAVRTRPAASQPQHAGAIDAIKTPPSSSSSSNQSLGGSSEATNTRRLSNTSSTSSSTSASLSLKKKVDDVFKRVQPHTIIQSYEKLLGGLKIAPSLAVNGELLEPLAAVPTTLSAGWKAAREMSSESHLGAAFDPSSGRFHYARCLQYAPSDPTLSLATIKTLHVALTSSLSRSTALPISRLPAVLTKKLWRLTAESSNKQIGLALYELPLGDWQHSSLVALVWTQSLEVVKFYLQLNIAELLHCAVQRPIKIPMDDVDPSYGLHSYIAAVTIRTFDSVLWEKEFYGVAFGHHSQPADPKRRAQVVTVELLDDANSVYRDRERYLSTSEAALPVATDAIAYAMDTALVVDVNVWEGSSSACTPVWGLSKPLPILHKSYSGSGSGNTTDFSLSAETKQSLVLLHADASRGNGVTLALEKLGGSGSSGKKANRVFVKQIELSFSLKFIDATFGTSHASK